MGNSAFKASSDRLTAADRSIVSKYRDIITQMQPSFFCSHMLQKDGSYTTESAYATALLFFVAENGDLPIPRQKTREDFEKHFQIHNHSYRNLLHLAMADLRQFRPDYLQSLPPLYGCVIPAVDGDWILSGWQMQFPTSAVYV